MTTHRICLLPGDGIGPEITVEALKVLRATETRENVRFEIAEALLGGIAIDETGVPLPDETLKAAKEADAVLLAAIGGPKWDTTDPDKPRPEQGLLGIRKELGLYANLRPVKLFSALKSASTLKDEVLQGVDMLIVRELTGGLYFGKRARERGVQGAASNGGPGQRAYDTMEYHEFEVERIARVAFRSARDRRGCVHSVDKANVLESSRMWREVVHRVHAEEFPEVTLHDQLVDNTAMQLIKWPAQFDVIVTENMFGDILSDEASMLTGSLGMLASASLGDTSALYEPSHGSAPDIAGEKIANPLAMLLSVELMLRHSFGMHASAAALSAAIERVLDEGWRTRDIADSGTPAAKVIGTEEMGDLVTAAYLGS